MNPTSVVTALYAEAGHELEKKLPTVQKTKMWHPFILHCMKNTWFQLEKIRLQCRNCLDFFYDIWKIEINGMQRFLFCMHGRKLWMSNPFFCAVYRPSTELLYSGPTFDGRQGPFPVLPSCCRLVQRVSYWWKTLCWSSQALVSWSSKRL